MGNYANAIPSNHVSDSEHIIIADQASNKLIHVEWALRADAALHSVCRSNPKGGNVKPC